MDEWYSSVTGITMYAASFIIENVNNFRNKNI